MLLDCTKLVPTVYRDSRDYQVFLRMLDMLVNVCLYETNDLLILYDPDTCPANLLPLLALHMGYIYNYSDTTLENRMIIKTFPKLIRNRGSESGIRLASALSINATGKTVDIDLLAHLEVFTDYESGKILIYFPNKYSNVRNLLDWVRPVGMYVDLKPAIITYPEDNMSIRARVDYAVNKYNETSRSGVEHSEVGFGQVGVTNSTTDQIDYLDAFSIEGKYLFLDLDKNISNTSWQLVDNDLVATTTYQPDQLHLNGSGEVMFKTQTEIDNETDESD